MNDKIITQDQFKKREQKFDLRYYLSTNFLGYPEEFTTRLKGFWRKGDNPKNKFFLFSSGRSGSTLLLDLINKLPDVYCDQEILKRKMYNPSKLIEAKTKLSEFSIYGFKLLSYQLRDVQLGIKDDKRFLENLITNGFKIIYLRRENKFLQALSLLKAISQAKWHSTKSGQREISKLEIDPQKLDNLLEELQILDAYEKDLMSDLPHLPVIYEKDLFAEETRNLIIEKICNMLEVQFYPVHSQLKKINPTSPSLLISNWEEVQNYLEGSRHRNLLMKLAAG